MIWLLLIPAALIYLFAVVVIVCCLTQTEDE